ncbi:MAG TPA: hypothetical protein VHW45_12130 [Candidatus Sulfotelmatobacter sp.]|jgi:hypothetical protein|nr:hypothetical protein [Candidatus Sulfotelmatobacter sp.]
MPGLEQKPLLTLERLRKEASKFAKVESKHSEPALYGVTDGKAVGTYLEHKFQAYLRNNYSFPPGNSARGVDFPELAVDIKVTSIKQPQSSCPFKAARQKVYGLGYSLLIFVYEKTDDATAKTGVLNILHTVFVEPQRTGDFQTTTGILKILDTKGNIDDLLAFFEERMLPVDDISGRQLAEEILKNRPTVGYLTISNALQWRLQYNRVIMEAGKTDGIIRVR